jgi:hypothetical protein
VTLERAHVPLIIREAAGIDRRNWPVTGGVPFAMGHLRSADHVRLLSPDGYEHPAQLRVTARWPDGSVRWLLVHFQADVATQQTTTYYLEPIAPQHHPGPAIAVVPSGAGFEVTTGDLRVQLNAPGRGLFGAFQLADQVLVAPGMEFTVEAAGTCYRAGADPTARWAVREHGPLRTVLTTRGRHANSAGTLLDFEVSLQIYAGLPWVEIGYTFLNCEAPAEVAIDAITVELPVSLAASVQRGLCGAFEDQYETAEPFVICQDRPAHAHGGFRTARIETTDGNIVDGPREGWNDVTAASHRARWEWIELVPWQAHGWVTVSDNTHGISLIVRDFAQMYPKRLAVTQGALRLELWPQSAEPLRLYQGQARTHRFLVALHCGTAMAGQANRLSVAYDTPLAPMPTAHWLATKALGDVFPYAPERYPGIEAALRDEFYAWYHGSQCQGMLDYGDYMQVTSGPRAGFMGNNEHDTIQALLLQYVRTGEPDYLTSAAAYARHVIDVDLIHHSVHPHERGGVRAHGQRHLLYETAFTADGPLQTSVDTGHQWVEGLLNYYFISGDESALDAARTIGECLLRLIQLGWCRPEPGPRNSGWPLIALTALAEATGEARFLEGCHAIVAQAAPAQLPAGYWPIMIGFRPAFCPWQNTVLMAGLARLHQLSGDPLARRLFLSGMQTIVEAGRFPDGTFIYVDAPEYRWSYYAGIVREPFGYAYHLTGDKRYLLACLHRPERWFWATSHTGGGANGNHISQWRGHLRFLYWADRAGLLDDLDY